MFEIGGSGKQREGSAPDVLDCPDDPAVWIRTPPVLVWVDLGALVRHPHTPYRNRPDGVFPGTMRGCLWAWVDTVNGPRLGVVTTELERAGKIVMTSPALLPEWVLEIRRPGVEHRRR